MMSHHIVKLMRRFPQDPCFWLGGGEVDVKLAIDVEEFVQILKPIVGEITL